MEAVLTLTGGSEVDDVRALHQWLVGEEELRGRVCLVAERPPAGRLGSAAGVLTVALTPGVTGALAGAVVAWLRQRTTDVNVKVERSDGTSVKVSARRLRHVGATELRSMVAELMATLGHPSTDESQSAVVPAAEGPDPADVDGTRTADRG
jgi:hypothetical protein